MQIQLHIPRYVEEMNIDLNDNEILFLNFLMYISKHEQSWYTRWNTPYYFHKYDLENILHYPGNGEASVFDKLRRYLDVGKVNDATICVQGHDNPYINKQSGSTEPSEKKYIITRPEVIATHYYLIGRLSCGSVVEENDGTIPYEKAENGNKHTGKRISARLQNTMQNFSTTINREWYDE